MRTLRPEDESDVVAVVVGLGKFGVADAARFPNLRTVAQFGAGTDNIDVAGLQVPVTCTANLSNRHVAELALAMIIFALRGAPRDSAGLRADPFHWRGIQRGLGLSDAVVGIIGGGNIGRETARLVEPLAGKVLMWNRTSNMSEIADRADVISVHLALNEGTRGLIGEAFFARVRSAQRRIAVVNTSRGTIIDEAALLDALNDGTVSAAAIDVWSIEGDRTSQIVTALRQHPAVLPTSHIGAFTTGVQRLYAIQVARNIAAVVEGRIAEIAAYIVA